MRSNETKKMRMAIITETGAGQLDPLRKLILIPTEEGRETPQLGFLLPFTLYFFLDFVMVDLLLPRQGVC